MDTPALASMTPQGESHARAHHSASRYHRALHSQVGRLLSYLAAESLGNEEFSLKFKVAHEILLRRSNNVLCTVTTLADSFGMTSQGMRMHLNTNPLTVRLRRSERAASYGSDIFIHPDILDLMDPST